MKRFCLGLLRFLISWRLWRWITLAALLVVLAIALVVLLEDWRGKHEWAVTRAKWEARGESFDYTKFVPPPVPDELNLAAIPLFALKKVDPRPDQSSFGPNLTTPALYEALRERGTLTVQLPALGNWTRG